jgi:hypothetical protein
MESAVALWPIYRDATATRRMDATGPRGNCGLLPSWEEGRRNASETQVPRVRGRVRWAAHESISTMEPLAHLWHTSTRDGRQRKSARSADLGARSVPTRRDCIAELRSAARPSARSSVQIPAKTQPFPHQKRGRRGFSYSLLMILLLLPLGWLASPAILRNRPAPCSIQNPESKVPLSVKCQPND